MIRWNETHSLTHSRSLTVSLTHSLTHSLTAHSVPFASCCLLFVVDCGVHYHSTVLCYVSLRVQYSMWIGACIGPLKT